MPRKKSVLVTGANGMLATDLLPMLSKFQVYAFSKSKLDITNKKQVDSAMLEIRPDVVINCAAYTDVDGSEINPACYDVNALGVYHLAAGCQMMKSRFYHISTDYVFDGITDRFYREDDSRNPVNHYGRSKMMGEVSIQSVPDLKWAILRVQWLFGHSGRNFVDTMLKLAAQKKEVVQVVNDQFGRPTNTFFLAKAINYMVENDARGLYHLGAADYCSWYDLACEVLRGTGTAVTPCSSDMFPRPAKRPKYSVLDVGKAVYQCVPLLPWAEHLSQFLGKKK